MNSLLISKVNDIRVIQVGDSKLSIENKNQDGSTAGASRKIGFVADNTNKTIDLGKGKKKHTLKLFVFNRSDDDALFKIFHEERYCTIVDKFRGKLKVYIDSIDITDSDKHIDETIYDISCTVQDLEKVPAVNFSVKLTATAKSMQDELAVNVSELTKNVSSFETKIDTDVSADDSVVFVDSVLNNLRSGVNSILDVKSRALEAYTNLKSRVDTSKRLFESIKNLKDFPNQFLNLISNITKDDTTNTSIDSKSTVSNVEKTRTIAISEPKIRGSFLSQIDASKISQIEKQLLKKDIAASLIINKIKTIKDINSVLKGDFHNQKDFEATVNDVIKRLSHLDYTQDEVSNKIYIVKSFANSQTYKDVVEIDITREQSLTRIVFDRYGNLDNYSKIEFLNNFKDNDLILGKVKVFA